MDELDWEPSGDYAGFEFQEDPDGGTLIYRIAGDSSRIWKYRDIADMTPHARSNLLLPIDTAEGDAKVLLFLGDWARQVSHA